MTVEHPGEIAWIHFQLLGYPAEAQPLAVYHLFQVHGHLIAKSFGDGKFLVDVTPPMA